MLQNSKGHGTQQLRRKPKSTVSVLGKLREGLRQVREELSLIFTSLKVILVELTVFGLFAYGLVTLVVTLLHLHP